MKQKNNRSGFSLVELLTVMSVAAVLMVVNVGWIHQSMKFGSLMNQRQRHHTNLTRLARELRDDVRQSKSLSMDGDSRLDLTWDDGTQVTYTISDASLVVEKRNSKKRINESGIIRDAFVLSPSSTVVWDTSEMPDWISLIVSRGREQLPLQPAEHSESPSVAENSMPVDLHVRVGPNRWAISLTDEDSSKTSKEQRQ